MKRLFDIGDKVILGNNIMKGEVVETRKRDNSYIYDIKTEDNDVVHNICQREMRLDWE